MTWVGSITYSDPDIAADYGPPSQDFTFFSRLTPTS